MGSHSADRVVEDAAAKCRGLGLSLDVDETFAPLADLAVISARDEWCLDILCSTDESLLGRVKAIAKRTVRSRTPQTDKTSQTYAATEAPFSQAADMGAPGTRSESMGSEPSEEDIRIRAYRRYLERGGGDGLDFEDWFEAEKELKAQPVRVTTS